MGNLLRLLSRDETPKYDVFVDFESESSLSLLYLFLIYLIITKVLLSFDQTLGRQILKKMFIY